MVTTIKVQKGLNNERTCPKHQVLVVGDLSKLSFVDLKTKLGDDVSDTYYNRVVTEAVKGADNDLTIVINDTCQMLHMHNKSVARDECCVRPKDAAQFLKRHLVKSITDLSIVLSVEPSHLVPIVTVCARLFPLFSMKTSGNKPKNVTIELINDKVTESDVQLLNSLVAGIGDTARLVDTPANILTTTAFVDHALAIASKHNLNTTVIRGDELLSQGFGGVYHVGKQSMHPPAFVVLSYTPATKPDSEENIVLVGKGIIFDTGGMQIKTKNGMPTMKMDMGGAAGVLGAFQVLIQNGFKQNLHCILCLAENMIGPQANRPDDIITLLSGKTCEINNTDAEGRLVLADGVYYAKHTLNATKIINMCTLTGAQRQATGKEHCAVFCNSAELQSAAITAGHKSGDMCHPLPFAPNLYMPDLKSQVADMKNSNLGTPQGPPSAVAACFIGAQIGFNSPDWLHIDMAALAMESDRATGFGVSLITTLLGNKTDVPLIKC